MAIIGQYRPGVATIIAWFGVVAHFSRIWSPAPAGFSVVYFAVSLPLAPGLL
jgi:hypothetical protein